MMVDNNYNIEDHFIESFKLKKKNNMAGSLNAKPIFYI